MVGEELGLFVGLTMGFKVGLFVGLTVGFKVGFLVGLGVGLGVGVAGASALVNMNVMSVPETLI